MRDVIIARKYGIFASQFFQGQLVADDGKIAVQAHDEMVAASQIEDLKRQFRQLERLLRRKGLEVKTLKEALEITRSKN